MALPGERVEEGVRRGVVGLAGSAEDARGGGEQDEGVQSEVAGQLVQVPGRVHLRPQDGVEPLGGERGQQAVVGHAGRVHHGRQRVGSGYRTQQAGQGRTVGRVAGGDGDLGAQRGQLGDQVGRARCPFPPPPGQQQVPGTADDQVPGEQRAERARAAGDQDGAVRVEDGAVRVEGRAVADGPFHLHQPRRQDVGPAQRQLWLFRDQTQRAGQVGLGGSRLVEVQEAETPGVLGQGRPQQPPDRRRGQVG